jgi:hypothetical protein
MLTSSVPSACHSLGTGDAYGFPVQAKHGFRPANLQAAGGRFGRTF